MNDRLGSKQNNRKETDDLGKEAAGAQGRCRCVNEDRSPLNFDLESPEKFFLCVCVCVCVCMCVFVCVCVCA